MRILVLASNDCRHDSRIKRAAQLCSEFAEVKIFAHDRPPLLAQTAAPAAPPAPAPSVSTDHFAVTRRAQKARKKAEAVARLALQSNAAATAPPAPAQPRKKRRFRLRRPSSAVFRILRHARAYVAPGVAFQPDAVHAHDLYTLWAGARIRRKTGARLVYDSHELETDRSDRVSWFERRLRGAIERRLIKHCDAVITVCDSLAEVIQNRYGVPMPYVAHNAPFDAEFRSQETLRGVLKLPKETPLAVYIGKVAAFRGLEASVDALALSPGAHLACVGDCSDLMRRLLEARAKAAGVADRLHFVAPRPMAAVVGFVRDADVSLALIEDICLSYRLCFPNKLMESLFAGVPVLASDLVELRGVIERTGHGRLVSTLDAQAIADGLQALLAERAQRAPDVKARERLVQAYGAPAQRAALRRAFDAPEPPPANAPKAARDFEPSELDTRQFESSPGLTRRSRTATATVYGPGSSGQGRVTTT